MESLERKIRKAIKQKDIHKGIWWRFFNNDTGANTISDMEIHLNNPRHENYKYVLDCMEFSINDPSGVQIYFS